MKRVHLKFDHTEQGCDKSTWASCLMPIDKSGCDSSRIGKHRR